MELSDLPEGAKDAFDTAKEATVAATEPAVQATTKAAEKVGESAPVEQGARLGYAASGILHLLMGWITLRIALGTATGDSADQTGAFTSIANTPGGGFLLWVLAAGFALHALWQLTEAIIAAHGSGAGDRIKAASKAVMYAALASTAFTFALGGRSSSAQSTRDFTAAFMGNALGRLLIGAVGLGIVGVGVYHVIKGWQQKFLRDLAEHPPAVVVWAGRLGYVAKGVALAIVGGLFVTGAWHGSTEKTTGLDGALNSLRGGPVGTGLLIFVAMGLMGFGLYCFGRARYTKV